MPERRLFPGFREQYAETPHPFVDTATLRAASGQTFPRDLLADASLYPIGAVGDLHLAEVRVGDQYATLVIGDARGRAVASAVLDPLDTPDAVDVTDLEGRAAGVLVANDGRWDALSTWPRQSHIFGPAAASFVSRCVIPVAAAGLRGVRCSGELLAGDVCLVGETGVVLSRVGTRDVRIDIVGDPLFRRRLCEAAESFVVPRFVKTINRCPPDRFGNYNITVGDHVTENTIIRIWPENGELVIGAIGSQVAEV